MKFLLNVITVQFVTICSMPLNKYTNKQVSCPRELTINQKSQAEKGFPQEGK